MRLSTSTNILCERPDGTQYPLEKTLQICREAGFDLFDMSFYEWAYPDMPFVSDQWETWIDSVAEACARLGVTFYQSHAYTYDFLNAKYESDREYQEMLVHRSLKCCGVLGAKVVVVHPSQNVWDDISQEKIWEKNKPYLYRWLEAAQLYGMELAVENMYQYSGYMKNPFFCDPHEIRKYMEDLNDPRIGVCWDFEHGAILEQDQPEAVRTLGKYLKATHVSDTASSVQEEFMHIMPFSGRTAWAPIMQALHETGYDGAFSFEAHNFAKKLPDSLIPEAMHFARSIGRYLMQLAGEA